MRLRNLLRAVAVLALLGLLPAGAAPPPAAAAPQPDVAVAPEVPAEVAAWFATEALGHVRAASDVVAVEADELDDVAVGSPRVVRTWAAEFIAGTSLDPVSVPLEEWIAPLVLQSAEQPVPVGTVRAWRDPAAEGAVGLAVVDGDVELARALLARAPNLPFILDPPLGAWFSTADGEVWPLTSAAEEVLVGSVPAEVFQPLLEERYEAAATPDPDAPVGGGGGSEGGAGGLHPALWAVLVVLVVGAAAGAVLVRQYRKADTRLDADVRAGGTDARPDPEAGEQGQG